jgi:hypothetical protein
VTGDAVGELGSVSFEECVVLFLEVLLRSRVVVSFCEDPNLRVMTSVT